MLWLGLSSLCYVLRISICVLNLCGQEQLIILWFVFSLLCTKNLNLCLKFVWTGTVNHNIVVMVVFSLLCTMNLNLYLKFVRTGSVNNTEVKFVFSLLYLEFEFVS